MLKGWNSQRSILFREREEDAKWTRKVDVGISKHARQWSSRRLAEVQVSSGRCPPASLAAALNRGLSKLSNP